MILETEVKIRIDDLPGLKKKLEMNGAEFIKVLHQSDTYFNAPDHDLAAADESFSVRCADTYSEIIWKGKRIRADDGTRTREIHSTRPDSGETAIKIFKKLGFTEVCTVEKTRWKYIFKGVSIELDDVKGLGTFAELESVLEDKAEALREIQNLREELGITGGSVNESYLDMFTGSTAQKIR